jgi:hypothetical protein
MSIVLENPWHSYTDWITNRSWGTHFKVTASRTAVTRKYNAANDYASFIIADRNASRVITSVVAHTVTDSGTEDVNSFAGCRLDDDRLLILYGTNGNPNVERARVYDLSTSTLGSAYDIASSATFYTREATPQDAIYAVETYLDQITLDLVGRVITTSGTAVSSTSSPQIIIGGEVYNHVIVPISTTQFVVFFNDASNDLNGIVVTRSGTTLSAGSSTNVNSTWYALLRADRFTGSTTGVLVAQASTGSPPTLTGWKWTVAGNAVSFGASNSLTSGYLTDCCQYDTDRVLVIYGPGASTTVDEVTDSAGTLTVTDTESLGSNMGVSDATYLVNGDALFFGLNPYLATYEGFYETIYSAAAPAPGAGAYVLGISNDVEDDGTTAWITLWKANVLYLQVWNVSTMTMIREISLGAATIAQVQNRTKVAYPFAASGDQCWIYGNMDAPAWLAGTHHVIKTTAGGVSGSWTSLSLGWVSDSCGAFYASADLTGAENRNLYAIRNSISGVPQFYYGLDTLALVSSLPVPAGTRVKHGGFHVSRRGEIAVGMDTYTTGTMVVASIDDGATWGDVTYDLPSGTVEVLRYF